MSMLLFYVGENRYVIDNRYILRITPQVDLKPVPYHSPYLVGLLNLGGKSLPVIDFCQLTEKRKASSAFHTRIILLKDLEETQTEERLIGLIGEKVVETLHLDESQFVKTPMYLHQLPYLKGAYSDQKGIIQLINVHQLFESLLADLLKFEG